MLIKLYANSRAVASLLEKGGFFIGYSKPDSHNDTEITVDTNELTVKGNIADSGFVISTKPAEKKVI